MCYWESHEAMRPWKLITLAIGLALLIFGAHFYQFSDWDVGISLIMGVLTYLTAPFTVRTILFRKWRYFPLAAFFAWFTVDGAYMLYHTALGHQTLRDANAWASTPLYLLMGCVWLWNGTLKELIAATIAAVMSSNNE